MNKYWVILIIALGLGACSTKNEHYYQTHLKELQTALKACPEQAPHGIRCEQLRQLANRMNLLAYELQASPQGFGNTILNLQQTIANQTLALKKNSNQELKLALEKNQDDLRDRVAVVRWLEAPTS